MDVVKCFSELEFKELKESGVRAIWVDPSCSWICVWLV